MNEELQEKTEEKQEKIKQKRAKILWNEMIGNFQVSERLWEELRTLLLDPFVRENMPYEVQKLFGRQNTRAKDFYWLMEILTTQYKRDFEALRVEIKKSVVEAKTKEVEKEKPKESEPRPEVSTKAAKSETFNDVFKLFNEGGK